MSIRIHSGARAGTGVTTVCVLSRCQPHCLDRSGGPTQSQLRVAGYRWRRGGVGDDGVLWGIAWVAADTQVLRRMSPREAGLAAEGTEGVVRTSGLQGWA